MNIYGYYLSLFRRLIGKMKDSRFALGVVAITVIMYVWIVVVIERVREGIDDEKRHQDAIERLLVIEDESSALFKLSVISAKTRTGVVYAYSEEAGFGVSFDDGNTWRTRNGGLKLRNVYPYTARKIRRITSVSVDPLDECRVGITTPYGALISNDYGISWESLPLHPPVLRADTFTAIALAPLEPDRIILGTSFSGIYLTEDAGATWTKICKPTNKFYRGVGYYETIDAVAFVPDDRNACVLALGFGGGIFRFDLTNGHDFPLPMSGLSVDGRIESLAYISPRVPVAGPDDAGTKRFELVEVDESGIVKSEAAQGDDSAYTLVATTPRGHFVLDPANGRWATDGDVSAGGSERTIHPAEKAERMKTASGKFGIYITAYHAGIESRFRGHVAFMKKNGFNACVVEAKDDLGYVTFDSKNERALRMGAVDARMDIRHVIDTLHANGIYCIMRIIVFKDEILYRFNDYEYALRNRITGRPWSNGREHWVDAYADAVHDYDIEIALELEEAGADEIQFDYIRFPTDGNIENIAYKYNARSQTKIEALESFLAKARERLTVPISIDVYGFNAWYDMGNNMGQSIEALSKQVDVIMPMFYPSHFPGAFCFWLRYIDKAEYIYRAGCDRAHEIVSGNALIRPYVQAFLLGNEKLFSEEEQGRYLVNQYRGTTESAGDGFILWNSSNNYYLVAFPPIEYMKPKDGANPR
jgi:hypothetical protein